MPLNTVVTGNTILSSDINQLVNVLQRAAGQTEVGKYFITAGTYANGAYACLYITSLSRGATPVSVSIDTADQAPSLLSSPTTNRLTANGFQIQSTGTGANVNCNVGGNFTIQY